MLYLFFTTLIGVDLAQFCEIFCAKVAVLWQEGYY